MLLVECQCLRVFLAPGGFLLLGVEDALPFFLVFAVLEILVRVFVAKGWIWGVEHLEGVDFPSQEDEPDMAGGFRSSDYDVSP